MVVKQHLFTENWQFTKVKFKVIKCMKTLNILFLNIFQSASFTKKSVKSLQAIT